MAVTAQKITEDQQSLSRLSDIFQRQRRAFTEMPMPDAAQRIRWLKRLKHALLADREMLVEAVSRDFGHRSPDETLIAEFVTSVEGINYAIKHVRGWMKPARRHSGALLLGHAAQVVYQPKGVVGIIVPWNYPIFLAVSPLAYALAAGNRAMLKLSENVPETSAALRRLFEEAFAPEEVAAFTGGVDVGIAFGRLAFDHLLFTGSTAVGRQVMRAAADNLTPVTLELGGKSPAILTPSTRMDDAVSRISFGKTLNAGQTCIAPDYVLCPASRQDEFVSALTAEFTHMYPTLAANPDYTSIVNAQQYARLQGYLEDARAKGADVTVINPASEDLGASGRKMPLHVLTDVNDQMNVMNEEIFGPILPVVPYQDLDEAIAYVQAHPRPLAMYVFGEEPGEWREVLRRTHSGGVCINDTIFHCATEDLPFGGTGESGIGQYHGHEGFLTFSHARAVLRRRRWLDTAKTLYPPHTRAVRRWLFRLLLGKRGD